MRERVFTGWTFQRALYAILGAVVMVQSGISNDWMGAAFGAYFASMGIFSFGCASGSCFGGSCATEEKQKSSADAIQDVSFEEIKEK